MFPLWPLSPIALCSIYGPLSPLWPSAPSKVLCPSTAHCPLYAHLSPLQPSVPPLKPYVPAIALCPIHNILYSLWSSAPHGPLLPLQLSILSMTLCFLKLKTPFFSYQPNCTLDPSVS
jgi:hypothetical protein